MTLWLIKESVPGGTQKPLVAGIGVLCIVGLFFGMQASRRQEVDKDGPLGSRRAHGPVDGTRWQPLSYFRPEDFGLHRDRRSPADASHTEYVPRSETDRDLAEKLRDRPVVVLYGRARAGKTRTLYEAVPHVDPVYNDPLVVITSPRAMKADVVAARHLSPDDLPVVFWFKKLSADVIDAVTLDVVEFLEDTGSRVVIEANIGDWSQVRDSIPSQWEDVRLGDELSAEEYATAQRILGNVRAIGSDEDLTLLGAVLSDDLDPLDDFHAIADPVVRGLVQAAADWDRTGAPRGATADELRRLLEADPRTRVDVPDDLGPSLRAATSQADLRAAALLLDRVAGQKHYRSQERLRRALADVADVPWFVWNDVVRKLQPDELEPVWRAATMVDQQTTVRQIEDRVRAATPAAARSPQPPPVEPMARERRAPPGVRRPSSGEAPPRRRAPREGAGKSRATGWHRSTWFLPMAATAAAVCILVLLPTAPQQDDTASAAPRAGASPDGTDTTRATPSFSTGPVAGSDPETEAEVALQSMMERDRPAVELLVDQWVPQLSAKHPGVEVGERTYQARDIRDVYDDDRGFPTLVTSSTQWRATYTSDGLWILLANIPMRTPEAVISWCDSHHLTADNDCFAVRLSRQGEPRSNVGYHE